MLKQTDLKKQFNLLQRNSNSVLLTEGKIDKKILRRLKKLTYDGDKQFVDLFSLVRNGNIGQTPTSSIDEIPIKTSFVEKNNDVDSSTLYSFDGPFQFLHADVENLEFLGKSATNSKCCLWFVNLFSSKVYVYTSSLNKGKVLT